MKELSFTVRSNLPIAPDVYELVLEYPGFEAKPGQFIHLEIPNAPHLTLRRPLSIHMVMGNDIYVQYAIKGEGTRLLSQVTAKTIIKAAAPLGNGFPTDDYDDIWVVGGGIGIPPLYTAVRTGRVSRAFLGYRSAKNVFDRERFLKHTKISIFTDDGTLGKKANAVQGMLDALKSAERKPQAVFACGPVAMFKALQQGLPEDIPCFISMEERMGCGVGACLVCACKVGEKQLRVCADGPVFPLREVCLDG